MKVQDVVRQILKLGHGCFLAKIDVDSAFRNVPVHPHDHPLLGMIWNQQLYIDSALPFGLRSAPKNFNAVAAVLRWIAVQRGVTHLDHFLNDFITAAATEHECLCNSHYCCILNLPLSHPKREGPSTILVFLGIELDTIALELRLPAEKQERLKSTGLLFHYCNQSLLSKNRFTSSFRDILTRSGIDSSQYSSHSFRIGAASTAAANGVEDSVIQTLGRWKSSACLVYM